MGIPMLKIRRPQDCLIFNMGIPILVRWHLYIEMAPWYCVLNNEHIVDKLNSSLSEQTDQQFADGILKCNFLNETGLALDILKVESWTQMGRTANIIIKCSIHVFASICKNMRILLMGRHYRERCESFGFWFKFHCKFVPQGTINKSTLMWVLVWQWTVNKPLPAVLTQWWQKSMASYDVTRPQ